MKRNIHVLEAHKDLIIPTIKEVQDAINDLKNSKALGAGRTTAELIKYEKRT